MQVFLFLHAEARKKCQASASTKPCIKTVLFSDTDAADFRQTLHPHCRHSFSCLSSAPAAAAFLHTLRVSNFLPGAAGALLPAAAACQTSTLLLAASASACICTRRLAVPASQPRTRAAMRVSTRVTSQLLISSEITPGKGEKALLRILDRTYLHQCFFFPVFFFKI